MTDLQDVNVWFALAVREHPHHAAASRYWQQRFQSHLDSGQWVAWPCMAFRRISMLGLVRLLCQPKAMGSGALSAADSLKVYQGVVSVPGIALMPEPEGLDAAYAALIDAPSALPPRSLTDAYLAAFAQTAQLRLVTFDRDFKRFSGTSIEILVTD